MLRGSLDQRLNDVKHKVIRMGGLVENIINMSMKSLMEHDVELAKSVILEDDKIDLLALEIEEDCMETLALQQPIAKDLRFVATVLKIITDLERIGDHGVNIANITIDIGKNPFIKPLVDIPNMAGIAQKMIKLSLDAFVKGDVELAKEVGRMDNEVDDIYKNVIVEIMKLVSGEKDFLEQGMKIMFVGRYLERVADHTTNICERTIYMMTGKLVEIN